MDSEVNPPGGGVISTRSSTSPGGRLTVQSCAIPATRACAVDAPRRPGPRARTSASRRSARPGRHAGGGVDRVDDGRGEVPLPATHERGCASASVLPSPVMASRPRETEATAVGRVRTAIQPGRRARRGRRSRSPARPPSRGLSSTGSGCGQPSSPARPSVMNVSRPSAENARVMPRGRTPSSTRPAAVRRLAPGRRGRCSGSAGGAARGEHAGCRARPRTGPRASGPRATLTPWPRSVPPSAIIEVPAVAAPVEVRRLGELQPRCPTTAMRGSSSALPVSRSTRTCSMPRCLPRSAPAMHQAREGEVGVAVLVPREVGVDAVDARRSIVPSLHGPAGSVGGEVAACPRPNASVMTR